MADAEFDPHTLRILLPPRAAEHPRTAPDAWLGDLAADAPGDAGDHD